MVYVLFNSFFWLLSRVSGSVLYVGLVLIIISFPFGILSIFYSPRFQTFDKGTYLKFDVDGFECPPEISVDELRIHHDTFRDKLRRRVFFRGANLGGSCKLPHGITTFDENGLLSPDCTFIGRPLDLETADFHLKQLRYCGMTFLRLLVTWEAIEPREEGVYDGPYIEYIRGIVQLCAKHGISVVIDPHQDVWSRWTGGDGAPKWTLEKLGFDVSSFYHTRAATVHAHTTSRDVLDPLHFPRMAWATNYMHFATATMFTLFFAGDDYAPKTTVDGVPVQEWLQGAYVRAMQQLAARLKDEPNVLGYEAMNEPSAGWVGRCSAARPLTEYHGAVPLGWVMSPWDGIRLANGATLDVPVFSAPFVYSHTERVNPAGRTAWRARQDRLARGRRRRVGAQRGVGPGPRRRPPPPAARSLRVPRRARGLPEQVHAALLGAVRRRRPGGDGAGRHGDPDRPRRHV